MDNKEEDVFKYAKAYGSACATLFALATDAILSHDESVLGNIMKGVRHCEKYTHDSDLSKSIEALPSSLRTWMCAIEAPASQQRTTSSASSCGVGWDAACERSR